MCEQLPCPRCTTGVAEFDAGRAANDVCAGCKGVEMIRPLGPDPAATDFAEIRRWALQQVVDSYGAKR